MPCSDNGETEYLHMLSRLWLVLGLLDELDSGDHMDPSNSYPPSFCDIVSSARVKEGLDSLTAELCGRLKLRPEETIRNGSLELQGWWIDHQIADRDRGVSP